MKRSDFSSTFVIEMTYKETLDYLYSQLPMFQRIGSAAYKDNLDNTISICKLLGNPENKFRSVHVAGTNGKGSTSHMLASVLQSSGMKVGLYTSPHLKDFRERIRINGRMIPEDTVMHFVKQYKDAFEKIKPSFFEMTVGLAFDHFANEKVDIAVIEVGLGGRLDSTNVITPLVSVITNISFDHVALLGDTIEKIAFEKAGIIKSGIPVVIGETQDGAKDVFLKTASERNAPILFADRTFEAVPVQTNMPGHSYEIRNSGERTMTLNCGLLGNYQRKNIPTVLSAIDELRKQGLEISDGDIGNGIANVVRDTGLLGRWQVLSFRPLVIADTAHNEAGIKEVLDQIGSTHHKNLHFVLGMVSDKDISKILAMLPRNATYYFCKAGIPRALDASELCRLALEAGLNGTVYSSVGSALNAAKKAAGEGDLVFVGGSTFTVAEVV
ncbi:MAG: bifunctional folylpolyglutamate synthase/dihydrofolate synthase [Bacteroidia bacterium]